MKKIMKRAVALAVTAALAFGGMPATLCTFSQSAAIVASAAVTANSWADLQTAITDAAYNVQTTIDVYTEISAGPSDVCITIPAAKNIVLNLGSNGSINRNLTSAVKDGFVIKVEYGGTLTVTGSGSITGGKNTGNGGGIYNEGILNIQGGVISGNSSHNGGGIYCNGGKTQDTVLSITGGSIENNTADNGGGVAIVQNMINYNITPDDNNCHYYISGGNVSNNTAHVKGGGFYFYAAPHFDFRGGYISGNTADQGGGVYCEDTTYSSKYFLNGVNIINNTAVSKGGGVYCKSSMFYLVQGTIEGNTAADYLSGGGFYNDCEPLLNGAGQSLVIRSSDALNNARQKGVIKIQNNTATSSNYTVPSNLFLAGNTSVEIQAQQSEDSCIFVSPQNFEKANSDGISYHDVYTLNSSFSGSYTSCFMSDNAGYWYYLSGSKSSLCDLSEYPYSVFTDRCNPQYKNDYSISATTFNESFSPITSTIAASKNDGVMYVLWGNEPKSLENLSVPQVETSVETNIMGYQAVLKGNIGVRFTVTLSDADSQNQNRVLVCSWNGKDGPVSKTFDLQGTTLEQTVELEISPAEMASPITVDLQVGGVSKSKVEDVTVKEYVNDVYNGAGQNENLKNLLGSLMIYGEKCQAAFGYNINESLAIAAYSDTSANVTHDDVNPPQQSDFESIKDNEVGLEYVGSSLICNNKTTLRHYYKVVDETKYNAASFKFNSVETVGNTKTADNMTFVYFDYTDISPEDLDKLIVFNVQRNSVSEYSYSPLNYIYNILSAVYEGTVDVPAATVDLVKALYQYHVAAKAFAANN